MNTETESDDLASAPSQEGKVAVLEESPTKRPDVPEQVCLNDFHLKTLAEVHQIASKLDLRVGNRTKAQIIYEILNFYSRHGTRVEAEGVLDAAEGSGYLRWIQTNFAPNQDSVYVPNHIMRRYDLNGGTSLRAVVRSPQKREKFLTVEEVLFIEGVPVDDYEAPKPFERLTALFPSERILLENKGVDSVSARVVDIVAPLGKGQRGLIVASPRSGKTILLKDIARAISKNHDEIELIVLLIDERPEEVTDFRETVDAQVISSTFDETPIRHIQVAELVMERARRLVEMKKDVVVLLDSITRLSRGYNNLIGGKGGLTQGGVNPKALQKAGRFFSAARNVEEGGSLTILATALVETENRMDDIIFEEFKGKGNMEIYLDTELAEKRVYPAIHTLKSGTRKDDLLYHPDEFARMTTLRRQLAQVPAGEAMEKLVRNVKRTNSNIELLLSGLK
ncbi:MAG: transcription termination factor Rho [Verrucomicrobiales bacterium]|jgi:transcription termination factor Rho